MDINARINWMPGMEITAQTFLGLENDLDFRQRLALRAALGRNRIGRLPGAPFNCKGFFVKNTFEIENFQCMAILPSGRIVNTDEPVALPIPMLFGDEYYLTVGFGDTNIEFERDDVPYVRPLYTYAIQTSEEVEHNDVFPVVKFRVKEGVFSVDPDYIPPCLQLSADERFETFVSHYADQLDFLANHPNFDSTEGKRTLLRYLFMLKGHDTQGYVYDLVMLLRELAQAVNYYIVEPHADHEVEMPIPSQTDVLKWLRWLEDYLRGAVVILDKVVLEDNTIDYAALLAQAKAELYEKLHPELIEKLFADLKEELQGEMKQLSDSLTFYIDNTMKAALMEQLKTDMDEQIRLQNEHLDQRFTKLGEELYDSLFNKLYVALYDALYKALYVPDETENYMPLI